MAKNMSVLSFAQDWSTSPGLECCAKFTMLRFKKKYYWTLSIMVL